MAKQKPKRRIERPQQAKVNVGLEERIALDYLKARYELSSDAAALQKALLLAVDSSDDKDLLEQVEEETTEAWVKMQRERGVMP